MRCFLMNKDRVIAELGENAGAIGKYYSVEQVYDKLPYGSSDINVWLEQRKASKHNTRLKQLMQDCGCGTTEGYIRVTHAASLNDTFWVKRENEDASWDKVSLYRNQFNEIISKLAFEGLGLYGLQMSGTSPELSTSGSFPKCWKKESDGIFLYKRGSEGAANSGLEPYCEALSSELASALCGSSVAYSVVTLHGRIASKCKLFTDESYGYLPYAMIPDAGRTADEMLAFYETLGSGDDFRRMCVLDALIVNTDRHLSNHGVLFNNDTLEIVKAAPVFDLNLALMPGESAEDLKSFPRRLSRYQPCIGDDFTAVAKALLTKDIRGDLINLKGFTFSFRGNDAFPEGRVKTLEAMINHHVDCLLDRKTISLAEVFPDYRRSGMQKLAAELSSEEAVSYAIVEQNADDSLSLNVGVKLEQSDAYVTYSEQGEILSVIVDGEQLSEALLPESVSDKDRELLQSIHSRIILSLKKL